MSLCQPVIWSMAAIVARLHRRRRAYAPTSNTASHDNHEKINSWVSFCFPYEYGAPLLTYQLFLEASILLIYLCSLKISKKTLGKVRENKLDCY